MTKNKRVKVLDKFPRGELFKRGRKVAKKQSREIRKQCNNLTEEERDDFAKRGMVTIYGGLTIKCSSCRGNITRPGAVLFGPPDKYNCLERFDFCLNCYLKIVSGVAITIEGKL